MIPPKPMLAHLYDPKRFTTPAFIQPKLDGVRALYRDGRFYSRDGHEWNPNVPAHLTSALQHCPKEIILDGELYVHSWPLQRINSAIAVKRTESNQETQKVQYHVFDCITPESFDLRLDRLWDTIYPSPNIKIVPTYPINSPSQVEDYFVHYTSRGYEGCMIRLGSYGYPTPKCRPGVDQDNRTFELLKRKGWLDGEFAVVGAIEGEGKHLGRLGALMLSTHDCKPFEVGTGFSDMEREELWTQYEQDQLPNSCKIRYRYLSADGIPCHTSFEQIL